VIIKALPFDDAVHCYCHLTNQECRLAGHQGPEAQKIAQSKFACSMGDPLDMLAEEASEIIKAVMKHKRFEGTTAYFNSAGTSARDELVMEIGDLLAVIDIILKRKMLGITDQEIAAAKTAKFHRLKENFGYEHV